jgi:N-acyl-D-amino-acid deacylase
VCSIVTRSKLLAEFSMFDVVIRNGLVVDGSGAPATRADIAVSGDRIAAMGDLSSIADTQVARSIDASGCVVSPGFIDIHTHSDLTLFSEPYGMSKISQGVTTEVCGNCGFSPFPITPERTPLLRARLSNLFGELVDWTWTDLQGYRDTAMKLGIGMNIVPLVGHSALRGSVVGFEDRRATPDEIKAMQRLTAQAMDQGAFGLSTGLTLPPSAYGDTPEIVALAETMAAYPGRFYTSHVRGWAGQHIKGVAEAVDIGRMAHVPVQVSHMAVNDPRFWGQAEAVIEVCESAVRDGFDVTFDVYPYAASSSGFDQCMPTWAQSGGRMEMVKRLRDPETRRAIREDMLKNGLFGGWPWLWDRLRIATVYVDELKPFQGLTFEQAGAQMGLDPIDAALEMMDLDEGRMMIIFYYRTEEDMRTFLRHPLAMMGSDGLAMTPRGPQGEGKPHPRSYGAHARVLGRYVREEPVLTLEEAIHKMSGKVADRLGLKDRGRLAVGAAADIVVFDPESVIDRADFDNPHQYPAGIEAVLVNGVIAVERGEHTGKLAGRVLEPN